jgi:hypothetical protein
MREKMKIEARMGIVMIASGNGIKNVKMRLIMGTRVRMRVGLKIGSENYRGRV